jgi:hypothetical protein
MSVRTNIVFDDAVWEALQQTPRGERSRVVNDAVADWLRRQRRMQASDRIAQRRQRGDGIGVSAEQLIREDRESH